MRLGHRGRLLVLVAISVGVLAGSASAASANGNFGGGCASGSNTYQGITISYQWCWNAGNVLTSIGTSASQPNCWQGCSNYFSSAQPNVSITSGGTGSTFAQLRVFGDWAIEANIAYDAYMAGLTGVSPGLPTVEYVYIYVRMNGGSSSPGVSATSNES
jgi:hypothetical protein